MKSMKKALAVFLVILTVFTSISVTMPVLASYDLATAGNVTDGNVPEDEELPEESEPEAQILSEITEKREENAKHFLMSDGSFMVAQYDGPVHELDNDGNWVDINNTITEAQAITEQTELFGTDELYSTGNITDNVVFAEKSNSNTLVSYEAKDYPISLNYQSAKNSKIQIIEKDSELTGNDAYLSLPNITQEVIYEDAFKNVDLQYFVSPTQLKENIILKNKNAQNTFTVNYNIGELTAEVIDTKTVNLMAGDEVVYTITAPYMTDANGAKSENITLTVDKNHNGKLRIDITADITWLQAENRAYPVVVDPSIVEAGYNELTATYVTSANPSTNYSEYETLQVSKNADGSNSYALLKLENLNSSIYADHIVSAKLNLPLESELTESLRLYLYEIESAWNAASVTFSDNVTLSDSVSDYTTLSSSSEAVTFDITKLYEKWGSDADNNNGVAVKLNDNGAVSFKAKSDGTPVLLLSYISTVGLDDSFSFSEFDMGTAGTVYINNLSGNLVVFRDDIGIDAYDLSSTYNGFSTVDNLQPSWFRSYQYGFRSDTQFVDENAAGEILTLKAVEDETDTYELLNSTSGFDKIKLNKDSTTDEILSIDAWYDEESETYTFDPERGLIKITVGDNIELSVSEAENGVEIIGADGNKLEITETDTSYSVKQIYLENGTAVNGDTLVYTKDIGGNVTAITLNGNVQASFTYDESGRMTSITNDVGYKMSFGYIGDSRSVTSVAESKNGTAGQQVSFTRTCNSATARTSGADGIFGNSDDLLTTYKFNEEAQLTAVQNKTEDGEDLGAVAYSYKENSENTVDGMGGLSSVSAVGKNVVNLLQNHNLESTDNWTVTRINDTASTAAAEYSTEKSFVGAGSMKIAVEDFTKNGSVSYAQSFTPDSGLLQAGETYTASVYVNASELTKDTDVTSARGYGAGVFVRIYTSSGTTTIYSDDIINTEQESNGGWERTFAVFTVPEDYTEIKVALAMRNALGTAYFDAAQLEKSDVPGQYNLLENNGFDFVDSNSHAASWTRHNLESTDLVENGEMKITGVPGVKKGVYQEVVLNNATQEDTYTYSGWVHADSVPKKSGRYFSMYPMVFYMDAQGNSSNESKRFTYFDYSDSDEQYVSGSVSLAHSSDSSLTPYKIRIFVCYYRECNTAYFDSIALYPSEVVYETAKEEEPVYVKDTNDCVTSCTYPDGTKYEYTYQTVAGKFVVKTETVTEVIDDSTTETTIYEYNASEQLVKLTEPDGTVYNYTYNSDGNLLSKLTSDGVGDRYTYYDNGDIYTEAYEDGSTYTYYYHSNGELSKEVCVEDGVTTTYEYDQNGNLTSESEEGTDENGEAYTVSTAYTYDEKDRVVTETKTENNSTPIVYSYTYDYLDNILTSKKNDVVTEEFTYKYFNKEDKTAINDKSAVKTERLEDGTFNEYEYYSYGKLKQQKVTKNNTTLTYNYDIEGNLESVNHNGFNYFYEYDAFGNSTSVKVGDQSLITYNYQSDKSKIDSVVYGDGSQINYTYNPYGQEYTKTTSLGTVTTKYDALGTLIYQKDVPGGIKTYYKYDEDGRLYGEKVATTDVNNSLENFLYSSHNAFDENGNISKNTVATSVRSYPTRYTYNENGLLTNLRVSSSRQKAYTYDEEDRLTGTSMSTATPVAESFTYNDEGLIATHTLGGAVYTYTYDDNGNITEIKKDDVVQQSYVYDEKNQLVRENNLDTNKTIVYTYDSGGNILAKTEYAFTLGELGTAVDTINYAYDSNWKDKLTSYDGQSITYDKIGNPEIYMGAEIKWFARQMQSYITDTLKITYKYDTDGLRTQKVVNGVEHNYYYVDGLLRIEEIKGSYTLNYRYDDRGVLTAVSSYNVNTGAVNILYAMTNTRGDVVALYDGDGDIRTRYTYDAWGKLVSVTDGDGNALGANKLGSLNSIRYRGYVYDTETGLYYLQSRYYDPETGRFLNADSVDFIGYSGEDISYNMFAYCENNMINKVDACGKASYRIFKTGYSWEKIIKSLLINCSVLYRNKSYYPNSAVVYDSIGKISLVFNKYTDARIYLKKRAQEIYFYKTYTEWCYYISVENKNILTNLNNRAVEKIAKILMTFNKKLDLEDAKKQVKLRIMEIEDVLVPLVDECYSLNIGFAHDVISIASYLIDTYYKDFSKEVKYISKILNAISKKYQKDKYLIFIPFFIYYESQVFYEVNFGRTGVRWSRNSTYKFFK